MNDGKTLVKFLKGCSPYNGGEVARIEAPVAKGLIERGIAVEAEYNERTKEVTPVERKPEAPVEAAETKTDPPKEGGEPEKKEGGEPEKKEGEPEKKDGEEIKDPKKRSVLDRIVGKNKDGAP